MKKSCEKKAVTHIRYIAEQPEGAPLKKTGRYSGIRKYLPEYLLILSEIELLLELVKEALTLCVVLLGE